MSALCSDYDKTLHQLDNSALYTTSAPQNDGQYNHTHHGHTAPPPIYSTLAEGGFADYSTIVAKEALEYSEIQHSRQHYTSSHSLYHVVLRVN